MYIALDIGGTFIKYGFINKGGEVVAHEQTPTQAQLGGPHVLKKLCGLIEQGMETYALEGICISTCGVVDPKRGRIIHANDNLPNYAGMELKRELEARFGIPCAVENDVACAALAEHFSGASKGSGVSVCLTVGTGIGAAIVIDGKIFHGSNFFAGEVGYMNMFYGSDINFESAASALALESKTGLSGHEAIEKAKLGDAACVRAIAEVCDMLGHGIANICYVVNPQVVVIGGGISAQEDFLAPQIRRAMDKYLIPAIGGKTVLAFAKHKNLAGLLGAYYNIRHMREVCR